MCFLSHYSQVKEESEAYGDMILSPELDMYRLVTYKYMDSLRYAVENYNFEWLVYSDNDTVVNLKLLDRLDQHCSLKKYEIIHLY